MSLFSATKTDFLREWAESEALCHSCHACMSRSDAGLMTSNARSESEAFRACPAVARQPASVDGGNYVTDKEFKDHS